MGERKGDNGRQQDLELLPFAIRFASVSARNEHFMRMLPNGRESTVGDGGVGGGIPQLRDDNLIKFSLCVRWAGGGGVAGRWAGALVSFLTARWGNQRAHCAAPLKVPQ